MGDSCLGYRIMASGCATTPPPDDTGVPLPAASSSVSKASSMPSRSTVEPTPARAKSATPTKIATTQPLVHRSTNGSLTVTVSGDLLWHLPRGTRRGRMATEGTISRRSLEPLRLSFVTPTCRSVTRRYPSPPKVLSTPAIQSSQCPLRSQGDRCCRIRRLQYRLEPFLRPWLARCEGHPRCSGRRTC